MQQSRNVASSYWAARHLPLLVRSEALAAQCSCPPAAAPSQSSKEAAERIEEQFLGKFDYAWNARNNCRKRQLTLHQRFCCLCIASGVAVVESAWQSPAKSPSARAPRSPAKQQQQQRAQPAAARQLQFVVAAR